MGCNNSHEVPAGGAKPAEEEKKKKKNQRPSDDFEVNSSSPFGRKYSLKGVLGKGNYSVVKEAVNRETGQHAAVKCIDKKELTQEDEDALEIETGILKEVDHPNIIQMYDFFEEERMYYIVTELMTGGELFDRIVEKEYYSERDAQKVVRTVADTLHYCHLKGFVHRDLKPENILLSSKNDDASIKIADFGFAKRMADGLSTACGTPGYVAPEIINGTEYGEAVDIWSLGVITYILLCGYPPFHDDNQSMLFRLIRAGKFEFDSPYWDEVSNEAKDLIKKMLTVDAKKRITAAGVLKHVWVVGDASDKDITPALSQLRKYQARRRWKKGIAMAKATTRLAKIGKMAQALKSPSAPPAATTTPAE